MSLDLEKLEKQLDEALKKETKESLLKWLDEQKTKIERKQKADNREKALQLTKKYFDEFADTSEFLLSNVTKAISYYKLAHLLTKILNDNSSQLKMQTKEIYYDKNGVEITDGCTIYNDWDRDKYHKIVKNENGELCFAIDMTPLDKRYATDLFWEVVNLPASENK